MSELLTARQAAAYLNVPLRSIYELGLPRYTLSARRIRFHKDDLDAHLAKCRSTLTKHALAGATNLTGSLTDGAAALRNCFRKAGVALKPSTTTATKAPVYTLSHRGSNSRG